MKRLLAALLTAMVAASHAGEPTRYGYRVLERLPQPRDHFVQGLQIHDGMLYVGTGHRGQSRLLRYHFPGGPLERGRRLHPQLFGEGVTVMGEQVYQLTWTAGLLLVYDRATLEYRSFLRIPGQGWGLTHNGRDLIYSDGSHFLHRISPVDGERLGSLAVTENGVPLDRLNELEWVEDQIWANVWMSDRVVVIDPGSGRVTASIDLGGLLPEEERQEDTDVLNGIARDPANGAIWVTGKRWPWLYRIELIPVPASPATGPPVSPGPDPEP